MANTVLCPVCRSASTPFLHRMQVPVYQNVMMIGRFNNKKNETPLGNIEMCYCSTCSFVFNSAFESDKIVYDEGYDNTQIYSPYFSAYMDASVSHLLDTHHIRNATIVEVGCGKGDFLKKMIEYEASNIGIGFDTTYVGEKSFYDNRLLFHQQYFDETFQHLKVDVLVCRHVIEHIAEPVKFLQGIRRILQNSPDVKIFFETPSVEWILENKVIWDFFYEHCSLFSFPSLSKAFEISGFRVTDARAIGNGQHIWMEAVLADNSNVPSSFSQKNISIGELTQSFAENEQALTSAWQKKIKALSDVGKVAIWGAAAKGVTFANLVDPSATLFDCVVDLNPHKQGKYLPGTGHSIVPYQDLSTRNVRFAVVMNPNYLQENARMLRESNIDVTLVAPDELHSL